MKDMTPDQVLDHVLRAAAEIFGHEAARTDNFFALGGDSVDAVELANALERRLGTLIDVALIMRTPDLGGLADAIGVAATAA
ncbi:hypothetical protein ADK38_46210 [Streptomyces varsoviensis]|uniref:Carrier domain-containing protein n=2 Tax=Streptomyces varsoviensis TaxID=67373 RepID=A0ABR5IRF3_9ACTN|nr:hypothetical protein ADK38_46210 [Streptomyces varsoviensis]